MTALAAGDVTDLGPMPFLSEFRLLDVSVGANIKICVAIGGHFAEMREHVIAGSAPRRHNLANGHGRNSSSPAR